MIPQTAVFKVELFPLAGVEILDSRSIAWSWLTMCAIEIVFGAIPDSAWLRA